MSSRGQRRAQGLVACFARARQFQQAGRGRRARGATALRARRASRRSANRFPDRARYLLARASAPAARRRGPGRKRLYSARLATSAGLAHSASSAPSSTTAQQHVLRGATIGHGVQLDVDASGRCGRGGRCAVRAGRDRGGYIPQNQMMRKKLEICGLRSRMLEGRSGCVRLPDRRSTATLRSRCTIDSPSWKRAIETRSWYAALPRARAPWPCGCSRSRGTCRAGIR